MWPGPSPSCRTNAAGETPSSVWEGRGVEDGVVVQYGHGLVAIQASGPGRPVAAHGERRRGIGIGRGQVRADNGDGENAARRLPGVRVDDVLAALVGSGGGDGQIAGHDHGGDAVAQVRVLDADAPRGGEARRVAAYANIAARVDVVVARAGPIEQRAGLDRKSTRLNSS